MYWSGISWIWVVANRNKNVAQKLNLKINLKFKITAIVTLLYTLHGDAILPYTRHLTECVLRKAASINFASHLIYMADVTVFAAF